MFCSTYIGFISHSLVCFLSLVYRAPHLLVFGDCGIEVYNVVTSQWVQMVPVRKLRSVSMDASISICYSVDPPMAVYIKVIDEDGMFVCQIY